METPFFKLSVSENSLNLSFKTKKLAETFARMDFHSRLLHSLAPDVNGVWQPSIRLDAEIIGWPKEIAWSRSSEKEFIGKIEPSVNFNANEHCQILEASMLGITEGEDSITGTKLSRFAIREGSNTFEYKFHSKSRTIAALCVLYDLKAHSRNDLEINIPQKYGPQLKWPVSYGDELQRTYGDPSKTADELRNEGWSRMGEGATMKVFRDSFGGQRQQMYQISTVEQSAADQMQRSNISKKWKKELYESQDFTCQICLTKYDESYLEPDHRVPVIYEADMLTDDNFKEKLMTLCRFCNQQKRETTKRLPADYDWKNSPWAYPEKFDLELAKKRLETYSKRSGKTMDQVIEEVSKK